MNSVEEVRLMGKDNRFLVLYHGALTTGRGIETLIKQVSFNDLIYGVILGDGEIKPGR